jgi:hypothetical protein
MNRHRVRGMIHPSIFMVVSFPLVSAEIQIEPALTALTRRDTSPPCTLYSFNG